MKTRRIFLITRRGTNILIRDNAANSNPISDHCSPLESFMTVIVRRLLHFPIDVSEILPRQSVDSRKRSYLNALWIYRFPPCFLALLLFQVPSYKWTAYAAPPVLHDTSFIGEELFLARRYRPYHKVSIFTFVAQCANPYVRPTKLVIVVEDRGDFARKGRISHRRGRFRPRDGVDPSSPRSRTRRRSSRNRQLLLPLRGLWIE